MSGPTRKHHVDIPNIGKICLYGAGDIIPHVNTGWYALLPLGVGLSKEEAAAILLACEDYLAIAEALDLAEDIRRGPDISPLTDQELRETIEELEAGGEDEDCIRATEMLDAEIEYRRLHAFASAMTPQRRKELAIDLRRLPFRKPDVMEHIRAVYAAAWTKGTED